MTTESLATDFSRARAREQERNGESKSDISDDSFNDSFNSDYPEKRLLMMLKLLKLLTRRRQRI